ncbi:MAG TPA: CPBP family intramembrane metalloprotease, partial [Polyangiaceae bacterium]|nr:CPBP family intramembrane metalloprotease [Polyangiaceae bacterium]
IPPQERPLSVVAAVLWFVVATAGAMTLIAVTHALRPGAQTDIVNAVACQAIAYFATILLAVRVHGGNRALADIFALRKTHPIFFLLGGLLGVCLQIPAELLQRLVFRFLPMDPQSLEMQSEMLRMDSLVSRIMIPIVVIGLGPFVEELFFRGLLFGGMRRSHGVGFTCFMVAVLFAGAHGSIQLFVPLLVIGGAITLVRAVSGSVGPGLVAHFCFNAIPILGIAFGWIRFDSDPTPLPWTISVGGVLATMLILAAFVMLSLRSQAAVRARQEDLR